MLILGIGLIAFGLYCAYKAGADTHDRARWEADHVTTQYANALVDASRQRHPSSRGPA
jgi:hypothetical protein